MLKSTVGNLPRIANKFKFDKRVFRAGKWYSTLEKNVSALGNDVHSRREKLSSDLKNSKLDLNHFVTQGVKEKQEVESCSTQSSADATPSSTKTTSSPLNSRKTSTIARVAKNEDSLRWKLQHFEERT